MEDREIEGLLAEAVFAHRQLPSRIAVPQAIMAIANKAVIPLDIEGQDRALLDRILVAAADLMGRSEVAPIKTPRINELGNAVEEPLLNACLRVGLQATVRRQHPWHRFEVVI